MIQDKILILRFKCGSRDALCRIYRKYKDYLLRLATALLNDAGLAEDVVHDVFVRFAQYEERIGLAGSLKAYLRTCVLNRARNVNRENRQRKSLGQYEIDPVLTDWNRPDGWVICKEESKRLSAALAQIPDDQREVVVLHLHGGLKFREIANLQKVSIKTTQSRYRYALEKLRLQLDSEVER